MLQPLLQQAKLPEIAVAICINDISQAVMMVTPSHLENFAVGFALSEGLISTTDELLDVNIQSFELGKQVNLTVLARTEHSLKQRRRTMAGSSGCGLCGIDSLSSAMTLPDKISTPRANIPSDSQIEQAKLALPELQKKYGILRGNHSAAFFDITNNLVSLQEDIGRHSALDKLIGDLYSTEKEQQAGFVLLTSRCSHDLVLKASRAKLAVLVTLAQPTKLAVSSALALGITLFSFSQQQLHRYA